MSRWWFFASRSFYRKKETSNIFQIFSRNVHSVWSATGASTPCDTSTNLLLRLIRQATLSLASIKSQYHLKTTHYLLKKARSPVLCGIACKDGTKPHEITTWHVVACQAFPGIKGSLRNSNSMMKLDTVCTSLKASHWCHAASVMTSGSRSHW